VEQLIQYILPDDWDISLSPKERERVGS